MAFTVEHGASAAVHAQSLSGAQLLSVAPDVSVASVFSASFLLVAPFWALVILAPTWRWTERAVRSPAVAVPVSLLYAALLVPQFGAVAAAVTSPTLDGVAALLGTDLGATLSWVHFLAFDLLVGRWVYLDARERGVSPLVTSPVLVATLLFGPLGFAAYWVVRTVHDRR